MICGVFLIVRARVQQVLITVLGLRSGHTGKGSTLENFSLKYNLVVVSGNGKVFFVL